MLSNFKRNRRQNNYSWSGKDPLTSAQLAIRAERLSGLYGNPDTTAFFRDQLESLEAGWLPEAEFKDILIAETYPGKQVRYKANGSHLEYLIQVYVANDLLVKKLVQVHPDHLDHANIRAFLTSDVIQQEKLGQPTLVAKTDAFISALHSQNTDTLLMVLNMLEEVPLKSVGLTAQDVDAALLREDLPNDPVVEVLVRQLLEVHRDTNDRLNLASFTRLFQQAGTPLLREQILIQLADDRTEQSWLKYGELIKQSANDDWSPEVFSTLYLDTLGVQSTWPSLVHLLRNGQNIAEVLKIGRWILDNAELDDELILQDQSTITSISGDILSQPISSNNTRAVEQIFELYEQLPTNPEILQQMQALYERKSYDRWSVRSAAVLLAQDQTLEKRTTKRILRDDQLRYFFVRTLNKYRAIDSKIKGQYKEEELARYLLSESMGDIRDSISAVRFDRTIDVMFKDSPYRVYLFTFSFGDDINRLAVVGLFSKDENDPYFIDEDLVDFTSYTISSRRRARKGKQMMRSLERQRERLEEDSDE